MITLTPFKASSSLCSWGALFSNSSPILSEMERHLMNLWQPVYGWLGGVSLLCLVELSAGVSLSSFLTIPSWRLLLPCFCELDLLLLGLSSSSLCLSFLKYQTKKLETITLTVKNIITTTMKKDKPSNSVTSVLSLTLSANCKSSKVIWVFGSKPLMPWNIVGITSLIAGTRKNLKPWKSCTVHSEGTQSPTEIGIGKT